MWPASFDVVAAGHLCLDIYPRFDTHINSGKITDILRPGALVHMGGMAFSTGGSVSNVGIAMKIFGCQVAFVAKVGDDPIGGIIIDILRQSGSAEGIAVTPQGESSYTVILAPPRIDRIFLHCPGTNDSFTVGDINMSVVEKARLFHLGYPTLMRSLFVNEGEELVRILKQVKTAGVITSLDISLPDPTSEAGRADWRRIYEKALPYADIFLPSAEETFFTLLPKEYLRRKEEFSGQELIDHISPEEFSRFADEYLDMGCRVSVIKAGHNGWYIKTAGRDKIAGMGSAAPKDPGAWASRELWCPAFYIEKVASAAGSGDSSIAGFLTGLLRGHSIEECLKLANCAGCLNLRALDTLSGLVSWEELKATVPTLKVRDNSFLKDSWEWNAKLLLWEKERKA